MDETQVHLMRCFSAVFPSLPQERIVHAEASQVQGWDSLAIVALFAAIEEEFGLEIEVEEIPELLSFPKLLAYLQKKQEAKKV